MVNLAYPTVFFEQYLKYFKCKICKRIDLLYNTCNVVKSLHEKPDYIVHFAAVAQPNNKDTEKDQPGLRKLALNSCDRQGLTTFSSKGREGFPNVNDTT